MSAQQRVARMLLERSPSSDVTDALLAMVPAGRDPMVLSTLPSPTVLASMAAGSVGEAVTVARDQRTPPGVLAESAKDQRKNVRRAAAANPSTPRHALRQLEAWALAEGDHDTLVALFATRDLADYLPSRRWDWPRLTVGEEASANLTQATGDQATVNVAAHLLSLPRPVATELLAQVPSGALFLVAKSANCADIESLTVDDVLDSAGTDTARLLAAAGGSWANQTRPVPETAVDAVVSQWSSCLSRSSGEDAAAPEWVKAAFCDSAPVLSTRSALALAGHGSHALALVSATALEQGRTPPSKQLARELSADPTALVAKALLTNPAVMGLLEDSGLDRCVRKLKVNCTSQAELVLRSCCTLSEPALGAALRAGSAALTWDWLRGVLPHAASAEAFLNLCQDPGAALGVRTSYGPLADRGLDPVDALDRIVAAQADLNVDELPAPLLALGWVMVRWCARYGTSYGSGRATLTGWVLDQLATGIPPTPEAWSIAANLATVIESGTINDFCAAVTAAAA